MVKQRYTREAMASAFRILGEGQLSLTKFLLVTDRHVDLRELQGDARARPGADAPGDRSLRVLEPVDGHARLHGSGGERGIEGRVARARRSGARAAAPVQRRRLPPGVTRRRASSAAAAWWSAVPSLRRRARRCRRGSRPTRRLPDWPLVVLTDEPARAARSDMNFLWTTFTRFEPAADIHSRIARDRAQSHRLHVPDRDRRAAEAGVSEGAVVRRRDRRAGDAALEGVLPVSAASRWATRSARTWTERALRSGRSA